MLNLVKKNSNPKPTPENPEGKYNIMEDDENGKKITRPVIKGQSMRRTWNILIGIMFMIGITYGLIYFFKEQSNFMLSKFRTNFIETRPYKIQKRLHFNPIDTEKNIKFLIAGDIMMNRDVQAKIIENGNDYTFPFRLVRDYINTADIKIANLESPITNNNKPMKLWPNCSEVEQYCCEDKCLFKSSENILDGIVEYAGFNVLAIENDHISDFENGKADTIKVFNKYQINYADEKRNAQFQIDDCKVAVMNYDLIYKEKGEISHIINLLQEQLVKIHDFGFRIVIFHGGNEHSPNPTSLSRRFAQLAIDNGADLVVMTHTHFIGPVEKYKDKYIFYGIGSFVYDRLDEPRTKDFNLLSFELESCKNMVDLKIIPGEINQDYQPQFKDTAIKEIKRALAQSNASSEPRVNKVNNNNDNKRAKASKKMPKSEKKIKIDSLEGINLF